MKILGLLQSWRKKENKLTLQEQKIRYSSEFKSKLSCI